VFLIQTLVPLDAGNASMDDDVRRTRGELVERFGGVTAYVQTPARGEWTTPDGRRERDQVVLVEVVVRELDRVWWRAYAETLSRRFNQNAVHIRALQIEVIDPLAT
jgi:hypothetical protein